MEPTWDRLMDHLLRSPGHTTAELRQAVFRAAAGGSAGGSAELGELAPFVEQVAHASYRITDGAVADLARTRSDDELFEVVIVAAAGAASARRAEALDALARR